MSTAADRCDGDTDADVLVVGAGQAGPGAKLDLAPQNAARAIAPRVAAGVLTELTGYKRNRP